MSKSGKIWVGAGLAGVLVAVLVVSLASSGPSGVPVEFGAAKKGELRLVVAATGEIQPHTKVNIQAQVIARVIKLHVREGDLVKKGDLLVELEREQYVSQRQSAAASLARAKAELERSRASLAYAALRKERAESLAREQIASREFLDSARLDYDSARTAYASAEEAVKQARASVRASDDALSKTSIVSPIGGRVTAVNAEEGETVVTGIMNAPGSIIMTVSDLSRIEAEVDVDETAVARLRKGLPAAVRVDALPDRRYHGAVFEIGDSAVKKSDVAYFKVKVGIADADERLRPGMTARARIDAEARQNVLVVPIEAVVEKQPEKKSSVRQKVVYRNERGKARAVPVEVGLTNETLAEILTGLKEGDAIMVGPYRTLKSLKDGEAVREMEKGKSREAGGGRREEKK